MGGRKERNMKYRKKPVVVEAYQTDKEMDIETLEGTMHASVGDYIITGVRGEQYPCKPDIFEQTYEPADAPTASPWRRVEDGMPDLLQFVVVCNDEGKCVVAQYVGYQTDSLTPWRIAYTMYDTDIYDEKGCGPVRYWMPIEPPKEEE